MREKTCVAKCCQTFWSVWYREYLDGVREQSCKSLGRGAAVIKAGNMFW